jgi:hypothetical protein
MNNPLIFENPCAICKIREATQLCDYIVMYDNSIIFFRNYKQFREENMNGHHETCDLPLCVKCSHKAGHHVDLCPHHYKLQQQAELPKHLKKAQMRQKAKILRGETNES